MFPDMSTTNNTHKQQYCSLSMHYQRVGQQTTLLVGTKAQCVPVVLIFAMALTCFDCSCGVSIGTFSCTRPWRCSTGRGLRASTRPCLRCDSSFMSRSLKQWFQTMCQHGTPSASLLLIIRWCMFASCACCMAAAAANVDVECFVQASLCQTIHGFLLLVFWQMCVSLVCQHHKLHYDPPLEDLRQRHMNTHLGNFLGLPGRMKGVSNLSERQGFFAPIADSDPAATAKVGGASQVYPV